MLEHVAPNIGDHPLAEPVHAIETRGAGEREDQADADQGEKIFVDEVGVDTGEAEIDHAPHGEWHGERGACGDEKREQRRGEYPPMAQEIGPQRQKRAERGARLPLPRALQGGRGLAVSTVRLLCHELHKKGPADYSGGRL